MMVSSSSSFTILLSLLMATTVSGYALVVPLRSRQTRNNNCQQYRTAALSMSTTSSSRKDADLTAFADSLEDEETTSSSSRRRNNNNNNGRTTNKRKRIIESDQSLQDQSWQACVDELLDPRTPLSRRQALLAKLVNANKDIQESVLTALRERKIDGLLTPTGKKLQDGTQTVARQLTNDILPNLAKTAGPPGGSLSFPDPSDVSKVGSRILNALSNQVQRNLELLQGDLANPVRIPQRISRQTTDLVTEARNVFSETPVGLDEPTYTVVTKTDSYEIRDYEGYSVASTTMGGGKGGVDLLEERTDAGTNLAETGAAFNTLAAYLFGANKQGKSMDMTTPVTTTSWGEMRFYLSTTKNSDGDDVDGEIPDPLDDVTSGSLYETGSVTILDIPPARLAVKKFTGFVTEGEIARQKDALLSALMMDDVELDVAHGDPISHVIFQYNPPYTLPMVRRNEIAVAVRRDDDDDIDLQQQWSDGEMKLSPINGDVTATMAAELSSTINGTSAAASSTTTKSASDDVSPSHA